MKDLKEILFRKAKEAEERAYCFIRRDEKKENRHIDCTESIDYLDRFGFTALYEVIGEAGLETEYMRWEREQEKERREEHDR